MDKPAYFSVKNENWAEQGSQNKTKPQNIKVILRVRPVLRSEFGKGTAITCSENKKTIRIDTNSNLLESTLDRAFDMNSTQQEIFEEIESYIPAVIQGFNTTIFAYGQTGSGKTHTMFGSDWENMMSKQNIHNIQTTYVGNLEEDRNFSGLIPRTIYHLFKEVQREENKNKGFVIYCSFLQIYNEKIFDLLTDKNNLNSLMIRENKVDGIYVGKEISIVRNDVVDGLTEYCVSNFQECLMLMQKGEKNRFIRHTSNNVKSSRSHTIFQLIVESTKADSSGKLQKAKFNLCDLAGSEKLNKSEEIANAHLKELTNINLSLTTLGKVIHNLSTGQKLPIPYRESKLTRLLQDSLGGNTKTCLIATLSPTLDFVDESINTLKFAERAKHIVTEVKANKIEAVDAELVAKLQKEIKYLKEILNIRRKGTSSVNEVNHKLLLLQEENERLRQIQLSVHEVEKLLEENKNMKVELQQLKYETQSEPRNFEATGGLTNFSKGQSSPLGNSTFEPKNADILDRIRETGEGDETRRHRAGGSVQSRKSSHLFDLGQQNQAVDYRVRKSSDGMSTASNVQSSALMTQKMLTQMSYGKDQEELPYRPLGTLQSRIKGKSTGQLKPQAGKPPRDPQVEQRKKEQNRALKRLYDLEEWQKQLKQKERDEFSSSRARFSDYQNGSETNSVIVGQEKQVNSSNYKHVDFDKIYDPYKVRQDIERKYNTQPKSQLQGKDLRGGEENSRIRNIQRNFF